MRYVFISAPFSSNPGHNLNLVVKVADELRKAGLVPFVPHLYMLYDSISPDTYEAWMDMCLAELELRDVVLRLPGHSPGADREVALAEELGMPVYYSLDDLLKAKREEG